jgi:hypothetical protein
VGFSQLSRAQPEDRPDNAGFLVAASISGSAVSRGLPNNRSGVIFQTETRNFKTQHCIVNRIETTRQ